MQKSKAFLVGAGMMACLISSCGSGVKYTYRENGIEYLNQGNYKEAVGAFDKAIDNSNGLVGKFEIDILKYRAEAEFLMGDYEAAAKSYEMLNQVDKKRSQYEYLKQLSLGQVFEAEEDYESAMAAYQLAIAADAKRAEAYNGMGLCKVKEGKYIETLGQHGDAIAKYNEAIAFFGQGIPLADEVYKATILYNEAAAYEYAGDFKMALAKFESYESTYGSDGALDKELAFLRSREIVAETEAETGEVDGGTD